MHFPLEQKLTPVLGCHSLGALPSAPHHKFLGQMEDTWRPGDRESTVLGRALHAMASVPFTSSEQDAWLPCVFSPLCRWGTHREGSHPQSTECCESRIITAHHPCTGGINRFGLLMSFRETTWIISKHLHCFSAYFSYEVALGAKEFACYSKVLVNFQTIVPSCVCLWQEERHCSFGLTFSRMCMLSETEGLLVASTTRVSLEPTAVTVIKETDFHEDGQKDSFLWAKYSNKVRVIPKIKNN